ncbi:unnamed protein product [Angiostrongylus costaricensis]|uniref:SER_THR_PHOSPHATASE domain-containing protein n=1 Tax=Angiostrongylus costaricensis TaxID=334426 RepID=A0A158PI13_ANGCS|nr:unnamed protein product [Angiostrongylus costaricensis]
MCIRLLLDVLSLLFINKLTTGPNPGAWRLPIVMNTVMLQGEVTVMGPIYGEGDSLITLLSLVGMPPQRTYLFLGCYFGLGFAPLESLLLLFCLKCLYPSKVYLLKGHLEEPASIKNLGLDDWLLRRKIPAESVPRVSEIVMEAAWAVMKLESSPVTVNDGIPTFTESQCSAFCKANGLILLVRGRQLVDEGFLNYPKEVLTIVSAVAYLDNFRNYAAAITFQGLNASVVRYKMDEGEPKSLDIVKPGIGRNSLALPL